MKAQPFMISMTGIDNFTRVSELFDLIDYADDNGVELEFGVLHYPEREGQGRNPDWQKRQEFIQRLPYTTAHLCGQQAFKQYLRRQSHQPDKDLSEIKQHGRIQANINAREKVFTDAEVIRVYKTIAALTGRGVIIQLHDGNLSLVENFLRNKEDMIKYDILLDNSKGKGVSPHKWTVPEFLFDPQISKSVGGVCFAGGLTPENIYNNLWALVELARQLTDVGYWVGVDMESGIRTGPDELIDDLFCTAKAKQVLSEVVRFKKDRESSRSAPVPV